MTPDERAAWLADRRHSLGASDAPAVLSLSPWGGPWNVWASKVLGWDGEETLPMRLGTYLEPFVAELVAERFAEHGWTLEHPPEPLMRAPADIWAHASPDRLVTLPGRDTPGVLQIKVTSSGEGWGQDGSDATPETVPGHYLLQTLWEMWVVSSVWAGYMPVPEQPLGWLAVLIAGREMRVYPVDWTVHRHLIEDAVVRCRAWWMRHIIGGEAPAVDASVDCGTVLAALHPKPDQRVALPAECGGEVLAWQAATHARWMADRDADLARNRLVAALGDAREGIVTLPNGDRRLVRRTVREGRNGSTYNTISVSDARGKVPTRAVDEDEGLPWSALDAVLPSEQAKE